MSLEIDNVPVSLERERRTYSRDSDHDCPESCRHLLDGIYGHLRRIEREVDENRASINSINTRLQATESRQHEQMTMLIEITGDVGFLKREVAGLQSAVNRLSERIDDARDMLVATCGMFQQHSTEEAAYQARQTASMQRLTRVMLMAAGSFGVLAISVATVAGLMGGEIQIMGLIMQLFGLGGG